MSDYQTMSLYSSIIAGLCRLLGVEESVDEASLMEAPEPWSIPTDVSPNVEQPNPVVLTQVALSQAEGSPHGALDQSIAQGAEVSEAVEEQNQVS